MFAALNTKSLKVCLLMLCQWVVIPVNLFGEAPHTTPFDSSPISAQFCLGLLELT